MRRGKRVDLNHRIVVDALRCAGWSVLDTHDYPGLTDAICWKGDTVRLVEIKSKTGRLTAGQSKLVARGCPIHFLRSADEALKLT